MLVTLATLNVNGLSPPEKQSKLLAWLKVNRIDIAMIQEARLSKAVAATLQDKKGHEHQIRTHYVPDQVNRYGTPRAGVAALVIGKAFTSLHQKGGEHDPLGGCAIYQIRWHEHEIHVANIYAPANRANNRINFFNRVKAWAKDANIHNTDIIMGDLNMALDSELDRSEPGARGASQAERVAWSEMATQLCGGTMPLDIWRTIHGNTKSWTRTDTARGTSSRLDYIFIRPDWIAIVRSIQTHPWEGSDHSAVRLVLGFQANVKRGPGRWRLNPDLLKSREVVKDIKAIIKNARWNPKDPIQDWIKLKESIASYCRLSESRQKRKSEKFRMKLVNQRIRLENRPQDAKTVGLLKSIKATVCRQDTWSAKNMKYNGIAKKRKVQSKLGREFYQSLPAAIMVEEQNITSLTKQDGTRINDQEEILEEARGFYETLWTAEPVDRKAQKTLLNGVEARVSSEGRKDLVSVVGMRCIAKAIAGSRAGRAPGPDGLPSEFYKYFSRHLTKKLRQVMRHYQRHGDLSGQLSRGAVALIYKKGPPEKLANYRPITLLNCDFKIFSRIIADRMKKVMKTVIGDYQCAYLDNRMIDDNILLTQSVIQDATQSNEPVSLALIDQEKAFDRVSHDYLWKVLKKFKFPRRFIRTLRHFYEDQQKQIYVNGYCSDVIITSRSVPQGDSASGLLYIAAIEPLLVSIKNCPEIPGIALGEDKVNQTAFADDLAVFLKDQAASDALHGLLQLYGWASNAKVNYTKTKILKIGEGSVVTLREAEVVLPSGQVPYLAQERYLGVPIGQNAEYISVWEKAELMIMQRIEALKKMRHDLRIRVILSKSLLLSKVQFLARFTPPPRDILKRIERVVMAYIWGGSKATLNKVAATLSVAEGGIKAMDIILQIQTMKVCHIVRMEAYPNLPWVRLVVKIIAGSPSRTTQLINERITKPWRQHMSTRPLTLSPALKSIMDAWEKSQHVLTQTTPTTCCEALSLNFWYPAGEGATARAFSCGSWREISSGKHGRADLLGDIWDPYKEVVRIERQGNCSPSQWRDRVNVVKTLVRSLPQEIKALLKEADRNTLELFRSKREEFCRVVLKLGKYEIPLRSIKHKPLYSSLLRSANRTAAERNNQRIQPLLDMLGTSDEEQTKVREAIWKGARSKEFLPRVSDFAWRMLHGRNIYGDRLNPTIKDRGMCYECGVVCTEQHLLIDCPMAQRVWEVRKTLWIRLAGNHMRYCPRPKTVNQLKLSLCRPGVKEINDRYRHRILTSLVVWALWKGGTKQWYDEKPMTGESTISQYKRMVLEQIHVDRVECHSTRDKGARKKLDKRFQDVWGLERKKMTVGSIPRCFHAI